MKYQALYRKYRPKNLNEVYGQKIAVNIVTNAILTKKINHAYLFAGSRGSGKTSIAKIVARMVNCENLTNSGPCEKCENCINSNEKNCVDIIEIDAASNNGVDEIRDLKSKVNLVPSFLKYKVYIIDEVHMLSTGAFNALLKTLEEPPEHVIFILATTELDKVPNTIISRCQVIEFKKINNTDMFNRIKYIAEKENINITDDAIKEIVNISDGSLRDGIGLLDMATTYTKELIDENIILEINGNVSNNEIEYLCDQILKSNLNVCLNNINYYYDNGKDLIKILEKVIVNLKNKMISQNETNICSIISEFSETMDKMKKSSLGKIYFEIALFKVCRNNKKEVLETKEIVEENVNESLVCVKNNDYFENKNDGDKFSLDVFKKVMINNSLVDADKNTLIKIKEKWNDLNNFTFDRECGALVCELLDAIPVVASDKYLVLSYNYDSFVEKGNLNHSAYEKVLLNKININNKIVFITRNEWNDVRKQYIDNIKKGIKYVYMEENFSENVNENKTTYNNGEKNDIIKKANELFDSAKIEIKESV